MVVHINWADSLGGLVVAGRGVGVLWGVVGGFKGSLVTVTRGTVDISRGSISCVRRSVSVSRGAVSCTGRSVSRTGNSVVRFGGTISSRGWSVSGARGDVGGLWGGEVSVHFVIRAALEESLHCVNGVGDTLKGKVNGVIG